jgi:hypothetical protein
VFVEKAGERSIPMQRVMQWLSLVACFLLGTVIACVLFVRAWNRLSLVPVVRAQDALMRGSKYVEIEPDSPCSAAKVMKVTVGKQVVTPGYFSPHKGPSGVPFQAADGWLKELKFTIKNRSSKKFVEFDMRVCFPDTEATGHQICQAIELGRIPEIDRLGQGTARPLDFRPGEEMQISFAPYADDVRKRIEERQPFSTISRCFINVAVGYFEDGMQWMICKYSVPDPSHPGSFKPADESELPVKDKRARYAPNEAHD